MPEKTYDKAVIFLGFATLIVAVGGILLAAIDKTVPDALWTALGAGIGGLAGIFLQARINLSIFILAIHLEIYFFV